MVKLYFLNIPQPSFRSLKKTDSAAFNSEKFQHSWSEQLSKKNPSFLWAIIRSYGWVFASAAIFKGGQDALAFLQPQLLHQLVFCSFFGFLLSLNILLVLCRWILLKVDLKGMLVYRNLIFEGL